MHTVTIKAAGMLGNSRQLSRSLRHLIWIISLLAVGSGQAQRVGQGTTIRFGIVRNVQQVPLQSDAAAGAVVGGTIGLIAGGRRPARSDPIRAGRRAVERALGRGGCGSCGRRTKGPIAGGPMRGRAGNLRARGYRGGAMTVHFIGAGPGAAGAPAGGAESPHLAAGNVGALSPDRPDQRGAGEPAGQ